MTDWRTIDIGGQCLFPTARGTWAVQVRNLSDSVDGLFVWLWIYPSTVKMTPVRQPIPCDESVVLAVPYPTLDLDNRIIHATALYIANIGRSPLHCGPAD